MTEFGAIGFDRISIRLATWNFISTQVIPKPLVRIKPITVIWSTTSCIASWVRPHTTLPNPEYSFGFFDFLWGRRIWQCLCHFRHPQRDSLRWNLQMTGNPPQVAAIHIHFDCPFSQAFGIAMMFWGGRVLPLTVHTPIPLWARIGFASFVLPGRCLAFWTFLHCSILAHLSRHSLISVWWTCFLQFIFFLLVV